MDKRFLLFLVLAAIVLIVTPKLFPTPPRPAAAPGDTTAAAALDTSAHAADTAPPVAPGTTVTRPATGVPNAAAPTSDTTHGVPSGAASPVQAETLTVRTPRAVYRFSTAGAEPVGVSLPDYKALRPGGGPVELVRPGLSLVRYALVTAPGDTVQLDRVAFTADSLTGGARAPTLTFHGSAAGLRVGITYTFSPDSYLVRVAGTVSGQPALHPLLLVTLPDGIRSEERDTLEDQSHLAYVAKPVQEDPTSFPFGKLDPGVSKAETAPLRWVASKNKYFVVALLTDSTETPFAGAVVTGLPKTSKAANHAIATAVQPLSPQQGFAFTLYAGPQEWRRLLAVGHDLQNVNPYGGFFQGVIQPLATLVMRVLLWMHDHLPLGYGWVLVIFGVVVRIVLWPLNQSAMRSSLKMQRIQPELQALQKKYKSNQEKLQSEMMKLYREHGMSPLSPVLGCLPMLIPMPVLFALYFVFLNTIEFRGVPFLWMVDISQKDPYYVLPLLMGASMFVLSWIGLRSGPSNSQAKMMAYVMPLVMTFLFARFAAGLNLYYAVQNIAALPQQWLIAQERAKVGPPATPPPKPSS